ncbi:unnamed protein product [Owenia fusiformis]|uniref:15-hydroxyprostaglandin dehydrogenase [NAD(+)] n=1 Tax=Owenia fusiformis TaxID=6347 RepID=A0A8J1XSQ7_OWEFU|nr:unnamed protein product [Owenia fusiformis]
MGVAGKVALITGGCGGLGEAFAEVLLKRGAKVCLVDLNSNQGEEVEQQFSKTYGKSVVFQQCDVTDKQALEDAFRFTKDTFGRLDIVANNAGITDEVNWEKQIAVNLTAVVRGTYLGLDYMRKDKGGHGGVIINTASMAGLIPMFTTPVYSATKHGVVGLSRAVGSDARFPKQHVRCNALCLSFANTNMLSGKHEDENINEIMQVVVAVTGVLEPTTVAEGFLRLVEDETLNGEVMRVTSQKGIDIKEYPRSETLKLPPEMISKL